METLSIPVVGYQTDEFPSFYSRSSGYAVPMRADSPAELASFMATQWDLGITAGLDIANPISVADEIPAEQIAGIIDRALADMDRLGISGKDTTPYLLGRVVELTGGASLTANIALVKNNALLGAQLATAYAELVTDRA
jgi:pseudouridine-5'-phosphate glycosidase